MREAHPLTTATHVGAPRIDFVSPPGDSTEGWFLRWLDQHRGHAETLLDAVRDRHRLPTGFVAVSFDHPSQGRCGKAVVASLDQGLILPSERYRRLMSIPYREFGGAVFRWRRGETVLLGFEEMPAALQLRFAPTPLRWSLNVPLIAGGRWIGIVGANSIDTPPTDTAIAGFTALSDTLAAEFDAHLAHHRFHGEINSPDVEGST